jgi:hypothetical protein
MDCQGRCWVTSLTLFFFYIRPDLGCFHVGDETRFTESQK